MIFCKCKCRYLLAIDPGLLTGVCLIDLSDPQNPVKVWAAEVTLAEFYDKIEDWVKHEDTHILIENYIISQETVKKGESPWSLNLIGVVKYFCYHAKKELDFQDPDDRMFADSEKLQAVNFWHVGGEGHANDSLRHAMVWIVNRNHRWAAKLL
jgi:hypothetical protein